MNVVDARRPTPLHRRVIPFLAEKLGSHAAAWAALSMLLGTIMLVGVTMPPAPQVVAPPVVPFPRAPVWVCEPDKSFCSATVDDGTMSVSLVRNADGDIFMTWADPADVRCAQAGIHSDGSTFSGNCD